MGDSHVMNVCSQGSFTLQKIRKLQQVSYRQKITRSHVICVNYCLSDPDCKSVNYHINNHLCELNNVTRSQYPDNFITHYGSVYLDADVNTPLLSLPDQATSTQPDTPTPSHPLPDQTPSTQPDTTLPSLPDQSPSTQPDTLTPSVPHYSSCKKLLEAGHDVSGIFTIFPTGFNDGLQVYCDMNTDGGGWIVIQRRQDGSVDFYRDWNDYMAGFGNLSGEFWLGNNNLRNLTESTGTWQLRIDLEDGEGNKVWADYAMFQITGENFQLHVNSYNTASTAGDSLTTSIHNGMMFTTRDNDNDQWDNGNIATVWKGAWWYDLSTVYSELNCVYQNMVWFTWNKQVTKSALKIRSSL